MSDRCRAPAVLRVFREKTNIFSFTQIKTTRSCFAEKNWFNKSTASLSERQPACSCFLSKSMNRVAALVVQSFITKPINRQTNKRGDFTVALTIKGAHVDCMKGQALPPVDNIL